MFLLARNILESRADIGHRILAAHILPPLQKFFESRLTLCECYYVLENSVILKLLKLCSHAILEVQLKCYTICAC